jgi:hypothetical protein
VPAPPPAGGPLLTGGNLQHDGHLVGFVNGQAWSYPPGTPLSQIAGVRPSDPNRPVTQTIIYVNGILNDTDDHFQSLQAIADDAGAEVIGVYNASENAGMDLLQCIGDKADLGHNPAVDSIADAVYQQLQDTSGPINLMAHSQGGIITSRALEDVYNRLREDGMSGRDAEALMGRINVDTFGAASWTYPDGPRYNHYVNTLDPVPGFAGQTLNFFSSLFGDGSREIHRFTDASHLNTHSFTDVYLNNWQSGFPQTGPR